MSKPIVSTNTINSICYDLAHDFDLTEKAWMIPALKSHVWRLACLTLHKPRAQEVERLVDQWIDVHERNAGAQMTWTMEDEAHALRQGYSLFTIDSGNVVIQKVDDPPAHHLWTEDMSEDELFDSDAAAIST